MPKMRGFKPEIWTDDKFVKLSPLARLLFMGTWNYACDNGHVEDKPSQLKMRILPADECDVSSLLDEIVGEGMATRHEGVLTIPNLPLHQRIDKRYFTACEHCDPTDDTPSARSAHDGDTTGTRRAPVLKEGRKEGEGDGEKKSPRRARQLPDDWHPNDTHRSFAGENRLNLSVEVAQFRDHHAAKGSTMKDWDAAFRTWLRNAVKWRGGTPLVAVPEQTDDQGRVALPPLPGSFWNQR